jgi:tetratricopeptide (TPR) repeat protein
MTQGKRYAVLGLAILAAGGLRMPFERQITDDLHQAGLLPPKLEQRTGEKIGQTFSAVSLGGLRTLVATFLNLRAFTFFTEQRWGEVGDTYEMIVDLAPRTRYYWDTGSWHQAYNAASHYLYESELPPLRRKANWRASILRGREFLERGIRNNPGDPILKNRLGTLLSDPNKIAAFGNPGEAYEQAYEAYMAAASDDVAPGYSRRFAFYSLARVPGRENDALKLLRDIESDGGRMPPTIYGLSYTLRYHENPSQPIMALIDSIFPSRDMAYKTLTSQWQRTRDRFPLFGVAEAIALLESDLGIPQEASVLRQNLLPPADIDDYFVPVK